MNNLDNIVFVKDLYINLKYLYTFKIKFNHFVRYLNSFKMFI